MELMFKVHHQMIARLDNNTVVSGSLDYIDAVFEFTPDWEGKTKNAIFSFGSDKITMPVTGDRCKVPWECLQTAGLVEVCVFGGNLITTSNCNFEVIAGGTNDGSGEPTPPPSIDVSGSFYDDGEGNLYIGMKPKGGE